MAPAATTTTLRANDNPSLFGQVVTFTATVSAALPAFGTPIGTVTFTEGAVTLAANVALTSGQATFTMSSLSVATHTITASYSGGGNFAASTGDDSASPQVVNKDSSITTVRSTSNSSVFGQPVTFTATVSPVSPGAGSPTGTVTFKEGAVTLAATVALTSGKATFTTSSLSAATHTITASYSGDGDFNASTGNASPQVVNKDSSTTSVRSTSNPSVFGQPVTFTATVSPASPGTGTPTGTVTFKEGAVTLAATVALASGKATFTTSSLSVATHTITASYSGDGDFNASTGGDQASPQVVNKAPTSTVLRASANPSTYGQGVTLTATVSNPVTPLATPTGSVTFSDGHTVLGTGTLVGGQATFSTSSLAVGNHVLIASYGGTNVFVASTSIGYSETVVKDGTATVLSVSPGTSVFGQLVTFTATVAAHLPAPTAPTGVVTFEDGITPLGSVTINAQGRATFATRALRQGQPHPDRHLPWRQQLLDQYQRSADSRR